ncbi:G-protein coupled receptor dmsr-1-like [Gigantopelta aegis]|uniref:G-protein coupled receptor dmsr-1-like n=1 Tax=Gigantopelta aegis TaxID=1735272 RepID=UPI001B88A48D|nr:G-protein coupled receptor dmsr-1-like [Gigantopelta aegis]
MGNPSDCPSEFHLRHDKPGTSTRSLIDTGSMSKQVYDDFMYSSQYVQFFLVILGILANVCNITVFARKRMRSATSTILTFLSCSELGVAIVEVIVMSCTAALGKRTYTSHCFWTLFQWTRAYLNIVFQRCSFFFNTLVATERFIAVRFPFRAKQIVRRMHPVVLCAAVTCIITGMHIFNPLKMQVLPVHTGRGIIYITGHSQLYTNDPGTFDVLSIVTKITFSYIPLFGGLVMNILMVTVLWNHRIRMALMWGNLNPQQRNESRQVQSTVTILISTFLFILLPLPSTATTFIERANPEYGEQKKEHYLFRVIVLCSGVLYLLSMSMDFLVYMILSRAFRQTFIFWCRSLLCHLRRATVGDGTLVTESVVMSKSVSKRVEASVSVLGFPVEDVNIVMDSLIIPDGYY